MPGAEEKLSPLQPQGSVLGIAWVVVPVGGDPERWGHAPEGTNIYIHSPGQPSTRSSTNQRRPSLLLSYPSHPFWGVFRPEEAGPTLLCRRVCCTMRSLVGSRPVPPPPFSDFLPHSTVVAVGTTPQEWVTPDWLGRRGNCVVGRSPEIGVSTQAQFSRGLRRVHEHCIPGVLGSAF